MQKLTFEPTIYPFQIDSMGHVSNIVYIQWMEIGRCKLLEAVGMPIPQIMDRGFGPILIDTTINYKKALHLGERVCVEVWISELSKASAWLEFLFQNGADEVAAIGRQRGLFIDLETGKPKRLTASDRTQFEPYLASEPQER